MPSVNEAPPITALVIENARSPSNPLGVKGVGEVGPSGAAAAIGNAVAQALGRGARVNALPLTPERIFSTRPATRRARSPNETTSA
jgi:CO/xanthine dehydrogenase Mo-binding subunit